MTSVLALADESFPLFVELSKKEIFRILVFSNSAGSRECKLRNLRCAKFTSARQVPDNKGDLRADHRDS